jgi:DNA-binding LacI/PurR family transcriptional regulator
MEMLHERISGYDGPSRTRILPVELIARRSTRRPEAGSASAASRG